ncbi:glycosyltransferase family 2 protein [bacterium]|nr:glycosyltransferase family 2 protein [bacterium]
MSEEYYLKIGRASDIENPRERIIYRLLEIFPGALSWGSLIALFLLAWKRPLWVAVFAIAFAFFWLLRMIYRSLLLRVGFKKMKEHEKINWIKRLEDLKEKDWRRYYHLVVFPVYKEPLEVLRASLLAIEKSDYPKDRIILVIGAEERAKEKMKLVIAALEKEFSSKFFKFLVVWHPEGIPGEIAGKSSNETWAVKKAKKVIIDRLGIPYENIIFSSFDADTVVFPKYFSCLTFHYLTSKNPNRRSFQPIPLFINNIWQAPFFSRLFSFSSTFWNTMNQASPDNLVTFSSHSMSFKTLVEVGFKQTNVVSDDSRIFWQCFLKYNGDYRVQPLYYPVSMDAVVAKGYFQTMKNVYKQQRRWAYGAGEVPYLLFGFLKNKKIPLLKKIRYGFVTIEGYWSWATSSFILFFIGWLPLVLGGHEFTQTLFSYNLPWVLRNMMTLAMVGLVVSAYFSIVLLPPKPPEYGRLKYLALALEWLVVPVVMLIFTPLPALEAQTRWMLGKYMGFWYTEKVRK